MDRIISFLNYLGKVVKKLVTKKLSQFCEVKRKLHRGQIRGIKHPSAIDTAVLVIYKVHKIWESKQVVGILLMDVKRVFNHVS